MEEGTGQALGNSTHALGLFPPCDEAGRFPVRPKELPH